MLNLGNSRLEEGYEIVAEGEIKPDRVAGVFSVKRLHGRVHPLRVDVRLRGTADEEKAHSTL